MNEEKGKTPPENSLQKLQSHQPKGPSFYYFGSYFFSDICSYCGHSGDKFDVYKIHSG